MATVPFVFGRSRVSNPGRLTFSYIGTRISKDLVAEKGTIPSEKYLCQWTLLRGKKPKWIFHNFGNLLHPLAFVPASHEHLVPTKWHSRAKVISIRAPQYRQYALISDFLYLAKLSIREDAALATNWIKDQPEGLKLQNLALAIMTSPAMSNLQKNMIAYVQYAINKCESLGPGKQLILHGNPSALARNVSLFWQSFDVIFAECALPMLYESPGHPQRQFWHLCCQR